MQKVVLATGNAGKVRELASLLSDFGLDIVAQTDLGVDSAEETGLTFIENAILKARHAAKVTGLPAIADDSGLAVDALGGAPGVYSARYGGEGLDDIQRYRLLLENMRGQMPRTARFVSVITIVFPDGRSFHTRGECVGKIAHQRIGYNGFGYDPIFQVGEGRSFASIPPEEKDAMSHRGKALRLFVEELKKHL